MEAQRDRHQLQAMAWNEGSRASGEENSMGVLRRNFCCSVANNAWKIVREISYLVERKETATVFFRHCNFHRQKTGIGTDYCRLGKIILAQQKSPNLKFKSEFASGEVNEQIRFFVEFGILTFASKIVFMYISSSNLEFCIKEHFVEFNFVLRRGVFEK